MFYVGLRHVFFGYLLTSCYHILESNAITNTSFNASVRDYTVNNENISNTTNVKTLQKELTGPNALFAPVNKPHKLKETADSALSSTINSHSRGLLYHEHQGYGLNDYEESPHYGYGHDYHYQDPHLNHHNPHIYGHYNYDHHLHPGYYNDDPGHYKYVKHALSAKAALWPLAGIALLGAAALAVSSPVLVQLGVVSGKRRRRDTEEITQPDFAEHTLKRYLQNVEKTNTETKRADMSNYQNLNRRFIQIDNLPQENTLNERFNKKVILISNARDYKAPKVTKHRSIIKSSVDLSITNSPRKQDKSYEDDRFIPIPIKLKSSRSPTISEPFL